MKTIALAWNGLPTYAAECLHEWIHTCDAKVVILATKARVPHQDLEKIIGCDVVWLKPRQQYTWKALGLNIPNKFIHSGWAYPAFNSLAKEVRRSGGLTYSMIDTIWQGRLKQYLGMLAFRIYYRHIFRGVWVPGQSGVNFCRRMGMSNDRIVTQLYGNSDKLFYSTTKLTDRPKRILFVGQLIERKGIHTLLEAAQQSQDRGDGWEFVVMGSGHLEETVRKCSAVNYQPFARPEAIADWMRSSRFLVLPSERENWGVVVHEAALCGCGLLLSDAIGSLPDLLTANNGCRFPANNAPALAKVLQQIANWSEQDYSNCQQDSLEQAKAFGPSAFSAACNQLIQLD